MVRAVSRCSGQQGEQAVHEQQDEDPAGDAPGDQNDQAEVVVLVVHESPLIRGDSDPKIGSGAADVMGRGSAPSLVPIPIRVDQVQHGLDLLLPRTVSSSVAQQPADGGDGERAQDDEQQCFEDGQGSSFRR